MTDPTLEWFDADQLTPHPHNPRLVLREDVVERIAAEIERSQFGAQHAITVRPFAGGHQVVSGHHRVEAARRVGVKVPAWVAEMDDDEAFMQLVLSNSQGELTALEYAVHVYRSGKRGASGRGRKGGLSDYARRLGIPQPRISERYAVGELVEMYRTSDTFPELAKRDPYSALLELTKAPDSCMRVLIESLGKHEWTVADTAKRVAVVNDFEIPDKHLGWLPLPGLVTANLADDRFKPSTVTALIRTADSVLTWIGENGTDEHAAEFRDWLTNTQGDRDSGSWSRRAISDYHAELIRRVAEDQDVEPERDDGLNIRAGDFRHVLADIQDNSAALVLTDPPYGDESTGNYADVAAFAARVLKPGGSLLCYAGQSTLPDVLAAMCEHLRYWWTLALEHNHGGQQLPGKWVMVEWKPIIWMVKSHRDGKLYVADRIRGTRPDKVAHEWAQGIEEVFYLIEQLTSPGDLVIDPFAGSGSFGRAAIELSRRFIGSDLNPGSPQGRVVA